MKLSFNGLAQVATSALLLTSANARTTLNGINETQSPTAKVSTGRKLMQDASAYNDPIANDQWYLKDVNGSDAHRRGDSGASIFQAHTITKGEGATVALIGRGWGKDAGIHADLDGAILSVPNEINAPESDPYSDGVIHTAGLIAARGNNKIGIVGAAPEAKLLPLHAENAQELERAIRWSAGIDVDNVLANENVADVIHIDTEFYAPTGCPESLQNTINEATAAGSIIVSPAGGFNRPIDTSPANCDNVIVVGASNVSGEESARLTNYGSQVDLLAPSGQVAPAETLPNNSPSVGLGGVSNTGTTAVPGGEISKPVGGSNVLPAKSNFPELTNKINTIATWYNDSYEYARGNSKGAALTSGVLALMRSVSSIDHAQAESILKSTAAPLTKSCGHGVNQCGSGRLNAFQAVTTAQSTKVNLGEQTTRSGEQGNTADTRSKESAAQGLSTKAINSLIAAGCVAIALT